jgi:dihydropteroate synthase
MRPAGGTGAHVIMGVVNVTPDSFSDGGRWFDHESAIRHGLRLVAAGAAVIDIGGESTRPFAEPVDPQEEQRRVLPVVAALAPHCRVSIDTRNAATARAAVEAGATMINDVSASLAAVAAEAGVAWVAMHMLGDPKTMQVEPYYDDVVAEVRDFLVERADDAVAAGVDEVWIDPGFGFGKTKAHNLALLGHLDALVATGYPVLVGLSRKQFVGRLLGASDSRAAAPPLPGLDASVDDAAPVPTDDRLEGSLATAVWAVAATVHAATLVAASSTPEAEWSVA